MLYLWTKQSVRSHLIPRVQVRRYYSEAYSCHTNFLFYCNEGICFLSYPFMHWFVENHSWKPSLVPISRILSRHLNAHNSLYFISFFLRNITCYWQRNSYLHNFINVTYVVGFLLHDTTETKNLNVTGKFYKH